jgi:hypothetical protein
MTITAAGLERQARRAYQGFGYRMFLANDPTASLTDDSPALDWLDLEISGNGYEPVTGVLAGGALNTGNGRWEQPTITWGFNSTGAGYTFSHRCLLLSAIDTMAIESVAIASNVATIITTTPHGFKVGDEVVIDAETLDDFDGAFTIDTVPAWDSFTFALTASNLTTTAETGTVVRTTLMPKLEALQAYDPAVLLAGGQSRGGTTILGQGI